MPASTKGSLKTQQMRELLILRGHDPDQVDQELYGGPAPNPANAGPVNRRVSMARSAAMQELDGARAEGFETIADSIEGADLATLIETWAGTPEALEEVLMDIRTRYAETRFDVAASISQAISDIRAARDESQLSKFIGGLMGTDVAQLGFGGAEVLGRSQQTTYRLLAGEGGSAFQRLFPKVVLHDPSNGGEVEWSPAHAAWEAMQANDDRWNMEEIGGTGKYAFLTDSGEHTSEEAMEMLRQANAEYSEDIMEFKDVVDAWAGEETMDEVYHIMYDQGFRGKIKMAGLATSFAVAEIVLDPLIILDFMPVQIVKGMRALGTTAQQAAVTARAARRSNRLTDLMVAQRNAETHLDAMLQQHQIERGSESMNRLRQAERNLAERVDAVLAQKNVADSERIYSGPIRGNPEVIKTREVMETPFEIKPDSPTRTNTVARARRVVDDLRELIDRSEVDLKQLKAKGSGATEDQVLRFEREIDRLKTAERRAITDPEDIPDVIPFQATFLRTRTVEDIAEIRRVDADHAARRPTTDYQPRTEDSMQRSLFEDDEMAARLATGPDDTEYAAEGLARLADGADPEDIGVPTALRPEYQAKTGGEAILNVNEGLIDLDGTANRLAELQRKATELRIEKDGKLRPLTGRTQRLYEKAMKELKKAKDAGEEIEYDQGWFPDKRKNIEDKMWDTWKAEYGATFGDRVAATMAPGAWQFKFNSLLGPGRHAMFLREPMRVLEEMDPGKSWPMLRNAMNNADAENARLMGVFDDALEDFGALTRQEASRAHKAGVTDPKGFRHTNDEVSEQLFDLLEIDRTDPKWATKLAELDPKQQAAVLRIRQELDGVAQKLGLTGTDKFVDGYMPHALSAEWFEKGGMPPELKGLSRNGNVFLSHLLGRSGGEGFVKDSVSILDLYSRGVSRKLYMEPALQTFDKRATQIARERGNAWYRAYADQTLSQLKGEASLAGRLVDHIGGSLTRSTGKTYRPGSISRKLMMVPSLAYASVLGANRRYPVMAISTALATTGARYGMFRTVKGMFQMATPEGQALWRAAGGGDQWKRIFEQADEMAKVVDRFTETASGARILAPSIRDSENFIRGMTFFAAIDENLAAAGFRTMADARAAKFDSKILFDAMKSTEEINHFFGTGAKPPIFSKISKSGSAAATQFLSFGPKQTEMLLQLAGENPGYIMRYMMLSGWMTRIAAQDMGLDLSDYLGVGYTRTHGTRDMTTPAVEAIAGLVGFVGTTTDFMHGNATQTDMHESTENAMKSLEAVVPLLGAARSVAKSVEAGVTEEQRIPGVGRPRPVDFTISGAGKGRRGEALGSVLGLRTVKERAAQDARRRIRNIEQKISHERNVLVERAFRMVKGGDTEGFNKQVKRLAELNVPFSDISDALLTRHEIELLHWHIQQLKRNPKLAGKIYPILEGYGIMGDGSE